MFSVSPLTLEKKVLERILKMCTYYILAVFSIGQVRGKKSVQIGIHP